METSIKKEPTADLRDYLAEERTLLAWFRTGIASMAFGFALGHFGIFADDPHATQHASGVQSDGLSLWLGAALIAAGVIVNRLSAWRYTRVVGELNRSAGTNTDGRAHPPEGESSPTVASASGSHVSMLEMISVAR